MFIHYYNYSDSVNVTAVCGQKITQSLPHNSTLVQTAIVPCYASICNCEQFLTKTEDIEQQP